MKLSTENIACREDGDSAGINDFYAKELCFKWTETDLIFAVITDVIHAYENSEKLPVLLQVQTLEEETAEVHKRNRHKDSISCHDISSLGF